MKYDIISVDWDHKQTEIWLHYVEKNCPEAHVTLIPDSRPIPWSWSGGKLDCFKQDFKTDKIIYMDTDTIVTKDLYHVFEDMGDCTIGLSDEITPKPYHISNAQAKKGIAEMWRLLSPHFPPEHFSSGMIVVRGDYAPRLYERWMAMMIYPPFLELFKGFKLAEEMSLMCIMANDFEREQIYNIPLEVHGNLLGRTMRSGTAEIPEVIHYHQASRARKFELGHYFEEVAKRHERKQNYYDRVPDHRGWHKKEDK